MATDEEIIADFRAGRRRPRNEAERQELVRRGVLEKTSHLEAIGRSAEQGLTLGFGDELRGFSEERLARRLGQSPNEARQRGARATETNRAALRAVRTDRPVTSFAGETVGSLGPGGLAFGGLRLARAAARPALYASQTAASAIHGAGSGETPEQRLLGAGVGGLAGLGGTAVGETLGYGASLAMREGLDPAARAARFAARSLRHAVPNERDVARRLAESPAVLRQRAQAATGFRQQGMTKAQARAAALQQVPRQGRTPRDARTEARRLIESGQAGPFTPDDMIARAQAVHATPGGTQDIAAEMFPEGINDLRAIAAVRGPGQSIVKRTLAERGERLRPNLLERAEATFAPQQTRSPGGHGRSGQRAAQGQTSIQKQPPPTGFQEFRQRLDIARRGQARQDYNASRQQPLAADAQDLLLREMDDTGIADTAATMAASRARAVQKRLSAAQRRGDTPETIADLQREASAAVAARDSLQRIAAGKGSAPDIDARVVEYYDRALGQASFDAGRGTPLGVDLGDVQKAFRELADEAAPALKQAREGYRGFRQVEEYLDSGRAIFKPSNADEMDALLRRNMTTEEADAFMVGALEAVEDLIAKGGEVRAVTKLTRNQHFMSLLERAAGSRQKANQFRDFIEASARQQETRAFVESGSPTTRIAEDVARLTGEDELSFIGDAVTAAQSGGALPWGLRQAWGGYKRLAQPGIRNPQVSAELANMLTQRATLPNMQALATRIRAAPQSPIFLPAARRRARDFGLAGSAATQGVRPEGAY